MAVGRARRPGNGATSGSPQTLSRRRRHRYRAAKASSVPGRWRDLSPPQIDTGQCPASLAPSLIIGIGISGDVCTMGRCTATTNASLCAWLRASCKRRRMKHRLIAALHIHPVDTWFRQLARRQHNFAFQMLRVPNWAAAVVKWCPDSNWQANFVLQLHRRPALKASSPGRLC